MPNPENRLMPRTSRSRPTFWQILLGLFVAWQLLFLLAGNAARILPAILPSHEEPNHLNELVSSVSAVTEGWMQLTGQSQGWRLFAPTVPTRALFVTVELSGPGDARVMASFFEPAPAGHFFHQPGSGDRLWHMEKNLAWPFVAWDADAVAQRPGEWRQYLEDSIRHQWRAYRGFLAWRLRKFHEEHPEEPAAEALYLQVQVFTPSAGTEQPASRQITVLVLRWRPGHEPPPGCLPLEMHKRGRWYYLTTNGPSENLP
jgi:hypothetical protein